jgi:hypothetical protein
VEDAEVLLQTVAAGLAGAGLPSGDRRGSDTHDPSDIRLGRSSPLADQNTNARRRERLSRFGLFQKLGQRLRHGMSLEGERDALRLGAPMV